MFAVIANCKNATVAQIIEPKPRGILNVLPGQQPFQLHRALPGPQFSRLVEHYWSVSWNLDGKAPYESETLPHPSVHLVLEKNRSEVVGVMRGRFTRRLEGDGCVFGIKFLPGAFRALSRGPIVKFTDRRVLPGAVFGENFYTIESEILSQQNFDAMAHAAEKFLGAIDIPIDANAELVREIVFTIRDDRTILRVDSVAEEFALGKRQLQRLFAEYVGVSPKWVIERYRMHEALVQLTEGGRADLASLAHGLGYFDQAHFHKAFQRLTGKSPGEYATGL